MKKYFKLIALFSVLAFTLFITGCSKKVALEMSDFKSKMESYGFEVIDATSYMTDTTIKTAYIAQKSNAYQIEFYLAKSENGAKAGYEQYVANLKAVAGTDSKKNTTVTKDTYSKYTDKAGDYYSVVVRIGNTYLYVRANTSYEKEINTILEGLGY